MKEPPQNPGRFNLWRANMAEKSTPATPLGLDPMDAFNMQLISMLTAIRALYYSHPDPAAVERQFDSLSAQMFATSEFVAQPLKAQAVRAWRGVLFRPPVVIEN
jgi:hypothetical protein